MTSLNLSETVKTEILPAVGKKIGAKNIHAIPRIDKVKVAIGVGKIARKGSSSNSMDEAILKKVEKNIATITNQKPRIHLSKKSISNFKLRDGMAIGLSTTLRGARAIDFVSKLVNVALPRVRDFRGISNKSFDGHGNYSLGMKDFTVFPEVRPEDTDLVHGIEVTICTTTSSDEKAKALLTALGFPFQKDTSKADAVEEAKRKELAEAQKAAETAAAEAGLTKEEPKKEEPTENENAEKDSEKPKKDSEKSDK